MTNWTTKELKKLKAELDRVGLATSDIILVINTIIEVDGAE